MEPMIDEKGNKHYITEMLGRDGQGTLFATKNSDIIIRVTYKDIPYDEYSFLSVIGDSLDTESFVLPTDNLKEPNIGYVFNIPKDFVPISTLNDTIGIKRRLSILAELAKVLIKLHAIPIMYGSMSHLRVLISPQASNQVRLLYSGKMNFSMGFKEEKDADTYISPEAAKGKGSSLASDSYTFGALAYNILTLGKDPGLHETTILTPELEQLFERAKGDPAERPKMTEFYKGFLQQLDLMLTCKKCLFDFFYHVEACPKCAAPLPKMIKANIYDKIGNTTIPHSQKILEFATNRQCFYNYHTDNVIMNGKIEPTIDCVLKISGERKLNLIFKNLMDKEIFVDNNPVATGQGSVVALPSELIRISFKLHSTTERCIDMVMV
ncbi:MAG: hypothetical protein FWC91_10710 [Defluviitaleaceae bacterium]|nr:hypothetical protein [Defluviitaleaceae bacterium]